MRRAGFEAASGELQNQARRSDAYKRAGGANGVQAISVLSEKYVWRFDIAMNDALRVSRLKSAHNRDECGNRENEVSPDAGRVYRGQ